MILIGITTLVSDEINENRSLPIWGSNGSFLYLLTLHFFDSFIAAENGNPEEIEAISSVVRMLGIALVAAVNLLSPEVFFGGGLAAQKKWCLEPRIADVEAHCYTSGITA